VFTNGFAIIFKGFCIVGREDKSVGLGGFVFRKEQFPIGGYGKSMSLVGFLGFLCVAIQVIVYDYVGV
jgi:hypothetical protein